MRINSSKTRDWEIDAFGVVDLPMVYKKWLLLRGGKEKEKTNTTMFKELMGDLEAMKRGEMQEVSVFLTLNTMFTPFVPLPSENGNDT